MILKEIIDKTTKFFAGKQIDTPRLDTEILLADVLGMSRVELYLKFDRPLTEEELQDCRILVKRRALGEPVAYIVGSKGFYKYRSNKIWNDIIK